MEHKLLRNINMKKSVAAFCHSDLLSVYNSNFAQIPMSNQSAKSTEMTDFLRNSRTS